MKNDLKE
jgi:hypothetical protein